MLDQVAEQLAAPAHTALEERKAQIRKTPGHAAEEQRFGDVVAGIREVTDMVEGEIRRAVTLTIRATAGVEGRRDAEFAALFPQQIIIKWAVDAELIKTHRIAREIGRRVLGVRDRSAHGAAEHACLGAELLDA